ncbi:MAG TPA: LysR family transcriptional regulator [Steroidobacteraceae bacterium]|jgi:DNA-binding transcriptional LysR family regulator|nr:LysR family transcriptional regulator [Steroidobacteraceae bacterium]
MLDAVTLDQLRTFIAAADEGSFSAAGRKLRRAQSVVSQTLANLEGQFGVKLFDRTRRRPVLTPQGQVLLAHARTVAGEVDRLKAHARNLSGGLEPELAIAVDVLFPMGMLTAAVSAFHAAFPLTPLRLYAETIGGVMQSIIDGRSTIGFAGELASAPAALFTKEPLVKVPLIHVTSPRHPLAGYRGPIPASELTRHIQLVLTDRSAMSRGQDLGVLSARTWRLADLGAKHAFLRAGLGWGGMPLDLVQHDLARGTLVKIVAEDAPQGFTVAMSAVYRTEAPPGIAGRWFIDRLRESTGKGREAAAAKHAERPRRRKRA